MDMMSRGSCSCLLCDQAGQVGERGALKGRGGERVVDILRFQGDSPRLCRLRTASFWPRWRSFELY
jgi:hypothetical protein